MPRMYEAIKKKLLKQGLPKAKAESEAAAIFNSRRPKGVPPVTSKTYPGERARDKRKEKRDHRA